MTSSMPVATRAVPSMVAGADRFCCSSSWRRAPSIRRGEGPPLTPYALCGKSGRPPKWSTSSKTNCYIQITPTRTRVGVRKNSSESARIAAFRFHRYSGAPRLTPSRVVAFHASHGETRDPRPSTVTHPPGNRRALPDGLLQEGSAYSLSASDRCLSMRALSSWKAAARAVTTSADSEGLSIGIFCDP